MFVLHTFLYITITYTIHLIKKSKAIKSRSSTFFFTNQKKQPLEQWVDDQDGNTELNTLVKGRICRKFRKYKIINTF